MLCLEFLSYRIYILKRGEGVVAEGKNLYADSPLSAQSDTGLGPIAHDIMT